MFSRLWAAHLVMAVKSHRWGQHAVLVRSPPIAPAGHVEVHAARVTDAESQESAQGSQDVGTYEVRRPEGGAPSSFVFLPNAAVGAKLHLSPVINGASALSGAAQIIDLGLGLANIGLSAALLVEARKQTKMLRQLQVGVDALQATVAELEHRSQRIDINVAEINLREVLRYAIASATSATDVDLRLLREHTQTGSSRFVQSLSGSLSPGTHSSLVFSPDVRHMLEAVLNLLWASRMAALSAHNLNCQGDPLRVQGVLGPQPSFIGLAGTAALLHDLENALKPLPDKVGDKMYNHKGFFGSSGDMRTYTRSLLDGARHKVERGSGAKPARALLQEAAALGLLKAANGEDVVQRLAAYLRAWSVHTDASLLWRLQSELELHDEVGYWTALAPGTNPASGQLSLLGAK